jgi:hypothetical protein
VGELGFWNPLGDCWPFGEPGPCELGPFGVPEPFCAVGVPGGCISLGDDGDPFVVGCPFGGCELAVGCEVVGACMAGAPFIGPPAFCAAVGPGCVVPLGWVVAVAGPVVGAAAPLAAGAAPEFGLGDGVVAVVPPDCGLDGVCVAGTSVG